MQRIVRWYDYITFNIYYFGLTAISQTMTPLVIPLLVQKFVGVANQGKYYGNIRLWSLMVALLAQALMGAFSDRSTSKWGRRRPFIFAGTLGCIVVFILIGFTSDLDGMTGYWILFALVILQMFTINTAQAGQQGIIPDLVPIEKRGRFSAVKAILEVPAPAIIVALTIGRLISRGKPWMALIVLMLYLLIVTTLTMFVPEQPKEPPLKKKEWKPFYKLLMMTTAFTLIILGVSKTIEYLINRLTSLSGLAFLLSSTFLGTAGIAGVVIAGVFISVRLALAGADSERKNMHYHSSYIWWVVSRLAFLVGSTNLVSFALYFLQANFGYEGTAAAGPTTNLTMFVGIFILIAALPAGSLTDKLGHKPLLAFSGLIAMLGTCVVILSPPSLSILYLGGSLLGIATGVFFTANWALGTIIVPQNQAGKYLGISNLAGAGAGAIGASIGGPIADLIASHSPNTPGTGYISIFVIYGFLFLVSVLTLKGIKENSTK